MKKTIFSSILMLTVLAFAPAAMAGTAVSIQGATTIGSASNSFTPSTKVGLQVISTSLLYAATSCHVNGTYEYGTVGGTGTVQDASKIYQRDIKSQSGLTIGSPDAPNAAGDLGSTGWN